MLRPIDEWYLHKEEPIKSCLSFMRAHILAQNPHLAEAWKYGMPFFCYKGKMCCYLWVHRKTGQPYLGIVEGKKIDHPGLVQEKRARMKIFFLDPNKDIPVRKVNGLLKQMLALYK